MGRYASPEKYEGDGLHHHRALFHVRVGCSATLHSAAVIGIAAPQQDYRNCRGRGGSSGCRVMADYKRPAQGRFGAGLCRVWRHSSDNVWCLLDYIV
jgi:hypothetical protein